MEHEPAPVQVQRPPFPWHLEELWMYRRLVPGSVGRWALGQALLGIILEHVAHVFHVRMAQLLALVAAPAPAPAG